MKSAPNTPRAVWVMLIILAAHAMATVSYTGSLSSYSAGGDPGLVGMGYWVEPGDSDIYWEVTQNEDSSWHYEYVLIVPRTESEISHFILETSPEFTEDDIFNESGAFNHIEIKNHIGGSPGNPDLPGDIYGIKFDDTYGRLLSIDFDSTRAPVWGDFYAKCGLNVPQQVWNAGLALPDPLDAPGNGSIDNHILVPDSVPEPASLLMMSIGVMIIRGRLRRKKVLSI
jgi:hypothetical protein